MEMVVHFLPPCHCRSHSHSLPQCRFFILYSYKRMPFEIQRQSVFQCVLTLANILKITLQQSHLLSNYDSARSFAPIRFATHIHSPIVALKVSEVSRCQISHLHFFCVSVSLRNPTMMVFPMMAIEIRTQTLLIHSINIRKREQKRENENKNWVLKWKCWLHILLFCQSLFPQRAD